MVVSQRVTLIYRPNKTRPDLLLLTPTKDTAEKLCSSECKAVLETLATMLKIDIAPVEARHASNREATVMRAKGWICTLATLSSKFITQCAIRLGFKTNDQEADGDGNKTDDIAPKTRKRKRGGGGAWRAFIHDQASGKKLDASLMCHLSDQYAQLSVEDRQKYVEAGTAGTAAHKAGFSSFVKPNQLKTAGHGDAKHLKPGDIQRSTGSIVAGDFHLQESATMQYMGPDFFIQRYESLKKEVNAEAKQNLRNQELSVEQQQALQVFEAKTDSEPILNRWHASRFSFLTSGFRRLGICCSDIISLEWVPSALENVKACYCYC